MNKRAKLYFGEWLDKYFNKDSQHTYYTWTYTYEGMHPNDEARWSDDDILDEYERYENDDKTSWIGLEKYEE